MSYDHNHSISVDDNGIAHSHSLHLGYAGVANTAAGLFVTRVNTDVWFGTASRPINPLGGSQPVPSFIAAEPPKEESPVPTRGYFEVSIFDRDSGECLVERRITADDAEQAKLEVLTDPDSATGRKVKDLHIDVRQVCAVPYPRERKS